MLHYNILHSTTKFALDYLNTLSEKRVFPSEKSLQQLEKISESLPYEGADQQEILQQLHYIGSQNTVASNGGRYFGLCLVEHCRHH